MTISEMYENNKNVKDLEEEIANHNAVIASGKKVGEMYFEQLKSMKEKYSSMSVISEKQIDDKVNEYEKKLDEYEKNNNRINELSELIESHNAMVISGRQVSEGYFKQIEEYKKELASMREIPHNKIMAYKRELAIAYKEKIKSAPEINKRYDETKEIFDVFNDINDKLELAKDKAEALLMSIDFSPEEIEMIDERLDLYYKFSNKYGKNEEEMLAFLENAKQKRNSILFADEELDRLNKEYDGLLNETVSLAEKLSNERKKVASDFEKNVKNELSFLDMPKMQFFVNFDKGNLSSTGFDKIEFMISANPGEPPKSLSKVASGGELSRIMLAIKSIISYNDTIGTLIFDEIDTGVSGRASQKIGLKLKSVSKNTQVICVTHSAQIASNANEHFLIQKKFDDNKTFTSVTPLDFEGRKSELARIMGGLEITDTLLQSAEELLNQNLYSN